MSGGERDWKSVGGGKSTGGEQAAVGGRRRGQEWEDRGVGEQGSEYEQGRQEVGVWRSVEGVSKGV